MYHFFPIWERGSYGLAVKILGLRTEDHWFHQVTTSVGPRSKALISLLLEI